MIDRRNGILSVVIRQKMASNSLEISVPEGFAQYMDAAIIRLQYLFPKIVFQIEGQSITVENCPHDVAELRKEISYALYREKIYAENIEIRRELFRTASK